MTDRSGLQSFAFAALRIVAGLMFACHGAQKLFALWGMQQSPPMWSQFWIAGVIELVCGILIAIGLFTRLAALLASGQMAVAYFQFHWKLVMDHNQFMPIVNKGELAALYCFLFLMFAAFGAGAYSADGRRGRP
jgi:putative oxidoreductase